MRRELSRIEGMDIPKDVRSLNPLVRFVLKKGIARGMRRGVREGRRSGELELVLRLLSRRLGAISSTQERAVQRLSLAKIGALGEALLDFRSKSDLTRWLESHSA